MAYSPRVVRAISREAIRRYGPGGYTPAEKRKIKSAFQTGIVESGLRNLGYGDADSAGWRQERASLYPNPTNLKASVRRYFSEADQLYQPGETAASLSGRVQRPASQYLYRYGEHSAEGRRLLRRNVLRPSRGRKGPNGVSPVAGASKAGGRGSGPPVGVPGGSQAAPQPYGGVADPEFSSRRYLKFPDSAPDVPASGSPAPPAPGSSLATLLKSAAGVSPQSMVSPQLNLARGVPTPRFITPVAGRGRTVQSSEGKQYRWNGRAWVLQGKVRTPAERARGPRGFGNAMFHAPKGQTLGAPLDRPGVSTSPIVRHFTQRLAGAFGKPIQYGTGTAHSQMTSSGNVSDHWGGRAIDLPASGTRLRHMAAEALRLVGVPRARARQMAAAGGIFNIAYKGHRFQIIARTTDHWDHLHVGIQ